MIWIFGDSFFNDATHDDTTWHRQLKALGPVENRALEATSLDWMYAEYSRHEGTFKAKDTVIVGLTTLDRTWFFIDNPQASQVFRGHAPNTISQQQVEAVMLYTQFLMNPVSRMIQLENFLARLDHSAQALDIQILVIASFPDSEQVIKDLNLAQRYKHMTFAQGNLVEISMDEWTEHTASMQDPRLNHLSSVNHNRLALLTATWILHNTPVILDQFETGIISREKALTS